MFGSGEPKFVCRKAQCCQYDSLARVRVRGGEGERRDPSLINSEESYVRAKVKADIVRESTRKR